MALFGHLHEGEVISIYIEFWSYYSITQKMKGIQIQQYKPICLFNVSFRFLLRLQQIESRLKPIKLIIQVQTAFMPGRHILEGVVVLHETVHELHQNKLDGVLFKINFEKAYDNVKWSFLQHVS
jgi:hypothetical protein